MTDQLGPVPTDDPGPGRRPRPQPSDDVATDAFPTGDAGGGQPLGADQTQRLATAGATHWPEPEQATSVMAAATPQTCAMPTEPGQGGETSLLPAQREQPFDGSPTTVLPTQPPTQQTQYLAPALGGRPGPPTAVTPAQPAPFQTSPAQPQAAGAAQGAERIVYVDRPVERVVERKVPVPAPGSNDSVIGWMGILLLMAIPVVGLVTVLVLACGGTSVQSRARFARAVVAWGVILVAAGAAAIATGVITIQTVTLPSWESVVDLVRSLLPG